MQKPQPTFLTADGAVKIESELKELKGPQRDALAHRLRDAIQMGDLSENADYHKAKEDQGFLEGRIQELEFILRTAIIVNETNTPKTIVEVNVRVTVQEQGSEPEVFHLVGATEADPRNGKISHESPIGNALMGHHVDDIVQVETPNGSLKLKILKID
jgi:transcription elongation factor GreA